jgi:hypothetical protein
VLSSSDAELTSRVWEKCGVLTDTASNIFVWGCARDASRSKSDALLNKLGSLPLTALPFISRNLECISQTYATDYVRIRGATDGGLKGRNTLDPFLNVRY